MSLVPVTFTLLGFYQRQEKENTRPTQSFIIQSTKCGAESFISNVHLPLCDLEYGPLSLSDLTVVSGSSFKRGCTTPARICVTCSPNGGGGGRLQLILILTHISLNFDMSPYFFHWWYQMKLCLTVFRNNETDFILKPQNDLSTHGSLVATV